MPRWLTVGIPGFTGNLYFLCSFLGLRFSGMHLCRFYNEKSAKFSLLAVRPAAGCGCSAQRRRQGAALAAGSRRGPGAPGSCRQVARGRALRPRGVDVRLPRPSQDESGGSCKKDDSPAAASWSDALAGARQAEMGSPAGRHCTGPLEPRWGVEVGGGAEQRALGAISAATQASDTRETRGSAAEYCAQGAGRGARSWRCQQTWGRGQVVSAPQRREGAWPPSPKPGPSEGCVPGRNSGPTQLRHPLFATWDKARSPL